jgi:hypothetical protein
MKNKNENPIATRGSELPANAGCAPCQSPQNPLASHVTLDRGREFRPSTATPEGNDWVHAGGQ